MTDLDALADLMAGLTEIKPYVHGENVDGYCGKTCRGVVKHVRMGNLNSPGSLTVFCSTTSCSCSMKVSDLPKRYRVTEREFERACGDYIKEVLRVNPAYPLVVNGELVGSAEVIDVQPAPEGTPVTTPEELRQMLGLRDGHADA